MSQAGEITVLAFRILECIAEAEGTWGETLYDEFDLNEDDVGRVSTEMDEWIKAGRPKSWPQN